MGQVLIIPTIDHKRLDIKLTNRSCSTCLFGAMCSSYPCKHYSPIEISQYDIDNYIEEQRLEYYDEYLRYIAEDDD